MAGPGRPITTFVNLNELPDDSRTCELCENHFSNLELNGAPGYAAYPVRLLCGHIFCYDCARMWISHAKCPECDARFADHTIALEAIHEQIRQYKQHQVACFNARLQAGMIRAPPGYPTFAGQQVGPSKWWHEDDTTVTAPSKSTSTSSDADEEMSDGDSELSELSSFGKMSPERHLAAQSTYRTLLRITNPDVDDDATTSDSLPAPSKVPSIRVTNPAGYPVAPKRDVAANGNLNTNDNNRETFAINKSEQTAKEFRMALGMINKVSGTNYSREDFPNLKLRYERKPRQ